MKTFVHKYSDDTENWDGTVAVAKKTVVTRRQGDRAVSCFLQIDLLIWARPLQPVGENKERFSSKLVLRVEEVESKSSVGLSAYCADYLVAQNVMI